MIIQVNQELCTGCGACVDVCSEGAIQLVDQRAVIDEAICTACGSCVDACPNEAIAVRSTLEPIASIKTKHVVESGPVFVRDLAALSKRKTPSRSLGSLAGAALVVLGREVVPRLVDVLISALEPKLARPTTTAAIPFNTSSRNYITHNKGQR
jgi:Fe-S-cluster-containing hydrogenase component 2